MKMLGRAVALLMLATAANAAEQRGDFAYGAALRFDQPAAACRTVLTADVYRRAYYADLRDLRVFNGNDEIVPYALSRPQAGLDTRMPLVAMPIFPLRGNVDKAIDALHIVVTSGQGSVRVQTPAKRDTALPIVAYLVDLRGQEGEVVALEFYWRDSIPQFATTADIAVSDNLATWRPIASSAPIVNLQFAGQQLVQRRVEFPAMRGKFLRIVPAANKSTLDLEEVKIEPVGARVEMQRLNSESIGTIKDGGYEFDLGLQAPIDRVSVRLPETNSLAQARFSSRGDVQSQWRLVAQSTIYRLQQGGREIESPAVVISPNSDRYWRMTVDGSGSLGGGIVRLQVGWIPARLTFIARGAAPFTLAAGNNLARDAEAPLDDVVERETNPGASKKIVPTKAQIGDFVEQGGRSKLSQSPPVNWKNWVLWLVLIVGVGLLALMARRLLREMTDGNQN